MRDAHGTMDSKNKTETRGVLVSPCLRCVLYRDFDKMSYAQMFLTKLKKMVRAHYKTQNRTQVRFGRNKTNTCVVFVSPCL